MLAGPKENLTNIPLLTRDNYPRWKKEMEEQIIQFGAPASALISMTKHVIKYPDINDHHLDKFGVKTPIRKYPLNNDSKNSEINLTSDGMRFYHSDVDKYDALTKEFTDKNDQLLVFILQRISPASKTTLATKATYNPAKISKDTFAIWQLIHLTHFTGTAKSMHRQLRQFLHLQQGMNKLMNRISKICVKQRHRRWLIMVRRIPRATLS